MGLVRAIAAAMAASFIVSFGMAAASACDPPPPHASAITALGKILVDGSGMTLYVFDGDGRYRPNCADECTAVWMPFQGTTSYSVSEARDYVYGGYWTIISRSDGIGQWAYGGRPLYHYAGDLKPGDTNGHGAQGGLWHVARMLCLPVNARGEPNEAEAVAVVDAALEAGVSPLKELRRWCGVELPELAERSGLQLSDLVGYEAGRKELSAHQTASISNGLGTPIYLLLE